MTGLLFFYFFSFNPSLNQLPFIWSWWNLLCIFFSFFLIVGPRKRSAPQSPKDRTKRQGREFRSFIDAHLLQRRIYNLIYVLILPKWRNHRLLRVEISSDSKVTTNLWFWAQSFVIRMIIIRIFVRRMTSRLQFHSTFGYFQLS